MWSSTPSSRYLTILIFLATVFISTVSSLVQESRSQVQNGSERVTVADWSAVNCVSSYFLQHEPLVCSVIASVLVGLSGVFPLLVIPLEAGPSLRNGEAARKLQLLLSFAVGSLLGDVFLHLLPEAWNQLHQAGSLEAPHLVMGLWVLAGIFSFIALEKLFQRASEGEQDDVPKLQSNGTVIKDGTHNDGDGVRKRKSPAAAPQQNGHANGSIAHVSTSKNTGSSNKHIAGYLNLLANGIDNYTHGLAVGASFLISTKVGTLTTLAILLHEVPHEISDFAILLKSGFNRWEAAKAQLATAGVGLLGAMSALSARSSTTVDQTAWILLFTAGGFINIALVAVLPDLMKEQNPRESIKQLCCMLLGTTLMAGMTCIS